jgi:hypothetical protein
MGLLYLLPTYYVAAGRAEEVWLNFL